MVFMKNRYIWGNFLKWGGGVAWSICRFRGWLGKKKGDGGFEGGDTPI